MAKKSVVERNKKRQQQVNKYWHKRQALKKIINNHLASPQEKAQAFEELEKQPRNASPSRLRHRCAKTGRPRGVYRKFGLCRHMIRELARFGLIPGMLKSSW